MAYDTITSVVDDVTDNLASYSNEKKTAIDKVMSSVAYANYGTATTSSGTITLTDASFPVQAITCGTANVVLRLPAVGTTNHPFFVINAGTAYTIQVQNAGSVNVGPVIPVATYRPYVSSGTVWFANDGMSVAAGADGNVLTAASGVWTSAAVAAAVAAASQAEQETGTSTAVFVSPGRQQFHPSAAKAWINFNGTGTPAIRASYNMDAITDNGGGDYTINFTTDFSSADYAYVVNGVVSTASLGFAMGPINAAPTAGAFRFIGVQISSTGNPTITATGVDFAYVSAVFYGDQ